MNTYADLYQALAATLAPRGHKPRPAAIGLYWVNRRPLELTISVRCGEEHEVWNVGRNLFIAAGEEWARGAWLGAGDFAVCYAGEKIMLGFRTDNQAVLITDATAVAAFIAHTTRLIPPGDVETAVTLERVDEALDRILFGEAS